MDAVNELICKGSDYLDEKISGAMGLDEYRFPDRMLLRRIRVDKLQEEVGEVQEKIIGNEGSNPRKATHPGIVDVPEHEIGDELLDVMWTAALAYRHVSGENTVMEAFIAHVTSKSQTHFGLHIAEEPA